MKVIVSHDVDNLTRKEHKKDLIVIKMIIRAFLELFLFRINISTFLSRLNCIIKNNFTNIFTGNKNNATSCITFYSIFWSYKNVWYPYFS